MNAADLSAYMQGTNLIASTSLPHQTTNQLINRIHPYSDISNFLLSHCVI